MKLLPLIPILIFLSTITARLPAEEAPVAFPDRVEIRGGVVLTGTIEDIVGERLILVTDYAGRLRVDLERVDRITSTRSLDFPFPQGVVVEMPGTDSPVAPDPAQPAEPARKSTEPSAKPATRVAQAASPESKGWKFEGGLDLSGRSGNTSKLDVTFRVDAQLQREVDRYNLYSRYSYGINRGVESSDEFIVGGSYTNFSRKQFGFFIREELEFDQFEGIAFRTTTASGLSWKVRDRKDLRIETRSGLSYRYEDYRFDGSEDFPGIDLGLNFNWLITPWVRLKGAYTYLPSVPDFTEFTFEQDSGFDMPLDQSDRWRLRIGIISKFNSDPEPGRERMDHQFYTRIIASWP